MIGDFARRCRLPISTLRYYDKIGLLVPAVVDGATGYRRYTVDQLPAASLIFRLRSLGMAPDGIERVLGGGPAASTALLGERRRIAAEIALRRQRLSGLDELLHESPPREYGVDVVDLAAREVAALPFRLPIADLETGVLRGVATLRSALRRGGHERWGPWGATFPLEIGDEISGFVFAAVAGTGSDDLDTAWLPATRAVRTVHRGGSATLPHAYHAAFAALDELGATAVGPVIEEYVTLDEPGGEPMIVHVSVPTR